MIYGTPGATGLSAKAKAAMSESIELPITLVAWKRNLYTFPEVKIVESAPFRSRV
jgi:hypothetical protein